MFKNLRYDVVFHNGRRLSHQHTFSSGTTLVTGANESGKSVFMEMLIFALYGLEALRGQRSDYESVRSKVTFTTGKVDYEVVRTLNTATLMSEDRTIATGQKGVTSAIGQLLGFNLRTFQTTCAIRQGDVEALGRMRPQERRDMIEDGLGIRALAACLKFLQGKASALRSQVREAKAGIVTLSSENPAEELATLKDILTALEERQSSFLQKTKLEQECAALRRTLTQPSCPQEPTARGDRYEELHTKKLENDYLASKVKAWVPAPKYSMEELLVFSKLQNAPPTVEEAELLEQENHYWDLYRRVQSFPTNIIQCPSCDHEFVPGLTAEMQAALDELNALPKPRTAKITAQHRQVDVEHSRTWWSQFEGSVRTIPDDVIGQIDALKEQVLKHEEAQNARAALAALGFDRTLYDREKQDYSEYANYQRQLAAYIDAVARNAKTLESIEELERAALELQTAEDCSEEIKAAERNRGVLERDLELAEGNAVLADTIEQLELELADVATAVEALTGIKDSIKSALSPQLSQRASSYMGYLTGRVRDVVVDDQMNVSVDGTPLHTLSGSAKACADISLRLALASAMTIQRFPVLLCDEPDASFDEERSARIASVLQALSSTMQIILVSHRTHTADTVISL